MQIRIPEERAEQARRLVQILLREPFQKRSWAELGYFLAARRWPWARSSSLGAIGLVGLVLTIVLVGIFILGGGLRVARGLGRWQRTLAWATLGEEISEPEPFSPAPGVFRWLRAALGDGAAWRSVLYFAAKVPLTLFGVWFALSLWVEAILGIASPLLGGGGPTRFGLLGHAVGTAGAPPGPPGLIAHVTDSPSASSSSSSLHGPCGSSSTSTGASCTSCSGPNATSSRVRSLEVSRSKTLDAATRPFSASSATCTTVPRPSWWPWPCASGRPRSGWRTSTSSPRKPPICGHPTSGGRSPSREPKRR